MIRILLVDDHALVRAGLRRLLTQTGEFEIVGEAGDGVEALALIDELKPDVALIDVSMPQKDGIETAAEIANSGSKTRVLMLTMYRDQQYAVRTLRAGADGFVWKGANIAELTEAIRAVHAGQRYLPPAIASDVEAKLEEANHRGEPRSAEALSKREFQVLCYLAAGMTNRQIASELGISVKTVDTHRGHLLKKLALRNNSDITRFAIRHGFVAA